MRKWYYLSFADKKFLGAVYLQSTDSQHAILAARALGINPGGEVLCIGPIKDDEIDLHVPPTNRYRLLSAAEIEDSVRLGDATSEELAAIGLTKEDVAKEDVDVTK